MFKSLLSILFIIISVNAYSQIDFGQQKSNNLLSGVGIISVTIGGDFAVTGTYPASITERIDQFITRMYEEAKEKALSITNDPENLQRIKKQLENYSLRNITLKRADGEVKDIDLLMFRVTGDFYNNPYLKNDDVLIFSPADFTNNFFTIDGAIKKPGKYPYVEGDMLSDAITLAQGINNAYEKIKGIEINRLDESSGKYQVFNYGLDEVVEIKRGDRIRIIAFESDKKSFSVTVFGDVNIPGTIPITKNNTTLKEVIEKAGGLKESAALNRARIFSGKSFRYILEKQFGINTNDGFFSMDNALNTLLIKLENLEMIRMSNLTIEDTAYFYLENQLRVMSEGSRINFSEITDDSSDAANYIVENGDIIIIPQKLYSVYVFGQVPKIGYIPFVKGADYKYYIEKAGGLGEYADDEIMVIKGKTRNWLSTENDDINIEIEDGDYIYVPKEPIRSFTYYVQQVGSYLSIASSVATVILLLYQFSK